VVRGGNSGSKGDRIFRPKERKWATLEGSASNRIRRAVGHDRGIRERQQQLAPEQVTPAQILYSTPT